MKRSIKQLILLLICIFLFANTLNTESTNDQDVVDSLDPNYIQTTTIDDFSDFFHYEDDGLIATTSNDNHISFDYSGGASSSVYESYVLTFDSFGDCTYFDVEMKFQYDEYTTGGMMSCYLYAGSYYDYLGNPIGFTYEDSSQHLTYSGFYDAWISTNGRYVSTAYVNDVHTTYESGGYATNDGFLTSHLIRNASGLYSLVYDTFSGALYMGHHWVAGIDKPVNFFMISFRNSPTSTNAYSNVYEIHGELTFADSPDTIDPYVEITYPLNDTYIPVDSATVVWDGNDNESGLARYNIKLDSNDWIDVELATAYTFYNLSYGYHTVEVQAVDNEANTFNDEVTFFTNITLDAIKPVVHIISPSNSSIIENENITVTWLGYDLGSGLKEYQVRLDNIEWLIVGLDTTYDFQLLTNGTHDIEIKAVDNNDNDFTATIHITIFIESLDPDIIAPELTILSPINDSIIPLNTITVIWSGEDNESGLMAYYIRLDSGEWIDINVTTYYTFNDLVDGVHTVEVKAVDNDLNERVCLISFTINTTPSTADTSGFTLLLTIASLISVIGFVKIKMRLKT
ncbi:MAG: Ig-like domain-containing protein [Candidatus Heimdallarchaeota archaeon]